jgi:hypothetical protein
VPEMAAWRTTSSRRPRLEMGLGRARSSALGAWQCPCELIVGAASSHLATECLAEIDPMNPLLVAIAIVSGGIRRGLALTDRELLVRSVDFTAWLLRLERSWNAVRTHVPVRHVQPFFEPVGH